jgi:hypothetical protein
MPFVDFTEGQDSSVETQEIVSADRQGVFLGNATTLVTLQTKIVVLKPNTFAISAHFEKPWRSCVRFPKIIVAVCSSLAKLALV